MRLHENNPSNRHPAIIPGTMATIGLLTAVAALFFFAWLAEEMLKGDTAAFDSAIREFVHAHSSENLTEVMRAFTFAGSTFFLTLLTAILLAAFVYGRHWWSACVFSIMMAGAVVLDLVLKSSFARDRPTTYFDTPVPTSYSFPSGHALFSLCFYFSLAWVVTRHLKRRRTRTGVWLLTALTVGAIGLSRIYLGVHYPSDVIAGYTAAFIWLIAVASGDRWLSLHKRNLNASSG
jgi:undecaprenyl-diphosphatase